MTRPSDSSDERPLFSTKRERRLAGLLSLVPPPLFLAGVLLPKPIGWVVVGLALFAGAAFTVWVISRERSRGRTGDAPKPETLRIGDRDYVEGPYGPALVLTRKGRKVNVACFLAGWILLITAFALGAGGPEADETTLQAVPWVLGVVLLLGSLVAPDLLAMVRRLFGRRH